MSASEKLKKFDDQIRKIAQAQGIELLFVCAWDKEGKRFANSIGDATEIEKQRPNWKQEVRSSVNSQMDVYGNGHKNVVY